jgi:DNA primase catalytic subunit
MVNHRHNSSDIVKEFYKLNELDLKFLSDCSNRHFRIMSSNGMFLKIRDRINNSKQLTKKLINLAPKDVYYSTSTYLNPTTVGPRGKERTILTKSGIVLKNDISFDLDREPLSIRNLEKTRKDCSRLIDFMDSEGYLLKYIAFSGSKGFHVIYEDKKNELVLDPFEREMSIIEKRRQLVKKVQSLQIPIDSSITVDTRRIIRLPGTINSKTGYACTILSRSQIKNNVSTWLSEIPKISVAKKIPRFTWPKLFTLPVFWSKRRKPKHPKRIVYTTFITSSVLGTKGRHAVLLSFKNQKFSRVIKKLNKAIKKYRLTDIYLFESGKDIQAISLKTVQRNRYQKIIDFVGSNCNTQLDKFNRVALRMGPLVNSNMDEVQKQAEFIKLLRSPNERENNFVSAGHLLFLQRHGVPSVEYPLIHGSSEFKLVDAEIKI